MRWWQTVSLVILAGVMALLRYWRFDFDQNFGYLDFQLYYQSLHDLVGGKIIYRDFYWEYGILYLGLGLPLFLLLQKSFLSTVLIRIFLFPALGFWVSWLNGRFIKHLRSLLFTGSGWQVKKLQRIFTFIYVSMLKVFILTAPAASFSPVWIERETGICIWCR